MLEANKIICGDSLEVMEEIPDKSIDMVLTDPPYNISRPNNFTTMGSACRQGMDFGEWDKNFSLQPYIMQFPRILKENANVVIFNSWQNLKDIESYCRENNIIIKRCLVISKSNPAPFNRDRMFVNDVEFALWGVFNSKNKPTNWTFNRFNPVEKCIINSSVQSSKLHPTTKDINVIKYLIKILSNERDTILDPFAGSGTTGMACKKLNRNFILIEREPEYCKIAEKRINSIGDK